MIKEKINIVVCDDHKLFRKGMSALLSDFEFIGDISEAGNGIELLNVLDRLEQIPDLILLDINMPEMDGIETTKQLKRNYPGIRILILSMEDDSHLVSFLVNEGINGYILKNADPEELELAIKRVMKNDFYFSSALASAILNAVKTKSNIRKTVEKIDLGEREILIIQLICQELTAVEIGNKLSLSARTIEGYKRKLLEKTGSRNMAGLVIFAIKNGFFNLTT
jgi:DNA-binding NarL/FixJ family response regulator